MDFQLIADAWLREDKAVLDTLEPPKLRAVGLIAAGILDEMALAAAGEEFVRGVKATSLVRQASVEIEKAEKPKENALSWVFSDEKPDRAGDIIVQDGWVLTNYKRNPVVLWGHALGFDSGADVPIGRAENVRVEKKRLVGDIVFAVNESERAAQLFKLAAAGFIKAGSVGFRPLKVNHIADEAERNAMGLGRWGVVFEKSELLEFSLCAVPCNAGALQQSVKSGLITEADADLARSIARATERDEMNMFRRRVRAFGATDPEGVAAGTRSDGRETESNGGALRLNDELLGILRSLTASHAEMTSVLRELRAQSEDDSASRRMLARSLLDLGSRLGATRAVETARPVADAARAGAEAVEKALTEALTKLNLAATSGGK